MNAEQYHRIKNLRWIKPEEVIFDVDSRELGFQAINHIAYNLLNSGYAFEIYYAEGQKSPHIHLKIKGLEKLRSEISRAYKRLFTLKYTPEEYHSDLDLSFYQKKRSPIAKEWKRHFKYKTPKRLLGLKSGENYIEGCLLKQAKREKEIKPAVVAEGNGWLGKVNGCLSILKIAESYGLSLQGNKAICPFHADKNPSLYFYDSEGKFYCFGCNSGGNMAEFLELCKEHKLKRNWKIKWQRKKQ